MSYFEDWINWVKQRKNKEIGAMADINNECIVIDSRDIKKEIARLEKRLEILTKLEDDFLDICPDDLDIWMKTFTLVRDTSFPEHTKSVATNGLGSPSLNVWPLSFINWKDAACALQKKYVPIDFDGVKYWVKKPI